MSCAKKTTGLSRAKIEELKSKIEKIPRLLLIQEPTPFHRLAALSARFPGTDIWMKRDDLTGLAFGGNKSRKLEYIISDALKKGADTIVTWGSLQSNWCLQTAAAARRAGLRSVLILFRAPDQPVEADGNLFLDLLVGAETRFVEAQPGKVVSLEKALSYLEAAAEEIRSRGGSPYLAPVGGSMPSGSMTLPLGAIAYVRALIEAVEQAKRGNLDIGAIIHATGSGGTQAGLVVGAKALGLDLKVLGVSVSEDRASFAPLVLDICRRTEDALGIEPRVGPEDVVVLDEYLGAGYGFVDGAVAAALAGIFREEAVVLDPVYTAKAMVGLDDRARRGLLPHGRAVVFFHTGGTPALFPCRRRILELAPDAALSEPRSTSGT
ncbi:MAG: D-cysteine desulfhydrase family protein [Candidatus Aminicenantes bacterium]|nr:D-cysteine desulfhydrase family protein [Candidatus Aminicenantes bacterium]